MANELRYETIKRRLENPPVTRLPGVVRRYCPTNSDEGIFFMARMCDRCEHDREWREHEKNPCDIMGRSMAWHPSDWEYPIEWIDEEWRAPRCTAFEPERQPKPRERQPVGIESPHTMEMF